MSIELADRPDISPVCLKGSNVPKEPSEGTPTPSKSKEDVKSPPSKKKKTEKKEALTGLLDVARSLTPYLEESQRIENERNALMKQLLDAFKNKNN